MTGNHRDTATDTGGQKEDGTYEGGKVNFTGQLFFDDTIAESVFALEPVHKKDPAKGYKGSLTLGRDPDAENTGAGGGGGGVAQP
ncbi:hypothetical protein GCM10023086_25650 [Streptomyces venetus]|uniref:Uncharacterized protein n=1 Tax=Streptomyces venetus TaxID=1701086 RepID=A0ABP8FMD1_9ACTN